MTGVQTCALPICAQCTVCSRSLVCHTLNQYIPTRSTRQKIILSQTNPWPLVHNLHVAISASAPLEDTVGVFVPAVNFCNSLNGKSACFCHGRLYTTPSSWIELKHFWDYSQYIGQHSIKLSSKSKNISLNTFSS